ncbi:hypothetical protein, partial [Pseudanabaena sp. UWO310]|uniref:hypothetical protein n=1 Tax=Pseudanabaena sp. UWO310 TaxID=2480795 RepID=UPI001CC209C9
YILATIHRAVLCVYSSVLVLVVVCLDCLSVYIPDFTQNTLHSQKAVENSSELGEPDKQKALEYLNQIGEMSAKEPSQKKGMLPILLDAFTGVISKASGLIEPVKKIAAAILSIWQT